MSTSTYYTGGPGKGLLDSLINAEGKTAYFDWDAATRLQQVTRPDAGDTALSYAIDGLLSSITTSNNSLHSYGYTPTDLVSSYTPPSPATGATSFTYNDDGQLDFVTMPSAPNLNPSYDATTGRLTSVVASSTDQVVFGYDGATGCLTTLSGPQYSGGSPLITLTRTYAGPLVARETSSGVNGIVDLDFDLATFQVSQENVITNTTSSVAYEYDGDGLVIGAQVIGGGSLTIYRDPATGRITRTCTGGTADCVIANVPPTDVIEERGYDAYGWLADLTYTRAASSPSVLYDAHYERDLLGRIIEKEETIDGVTAVYVYTYDDAGRLTDVIKDGILVEHYGYDANGNRTTTTNSGGTKTSVFDGQDRITSFGGSTVTHNARGEVTSRTSPALSLTRNAFGDLLSASANGGSTQSYEVDALGRRRKTASARYLWRGDLAIVAQLSVVLGDLSRRFVYGTNANVPDLMIDSGGVQHRLIKDHLGSVRSVVRLTDGAVVRRMDFDSYGRLLASSGSSSTVPFGFAGGLWHSNTGLVRFGARDYDPEMGRWLTKDPAQFGGGTNFYEYANSDPVNYVDPTGHVPEHARDWGFGFAGIGREDEETRIAIRESKASQFAAEAALNIWGALLFEGVIAGRAGVALMCGGGSGTRVCFAAGTLIETEEGLRPIE